MKQIVIAQRAREVLRYDATTGLLTWLVTKGRRAKVGAVAGSVNGVKAYIRVIVDGRKYLAHRLIWLIVHGEWPQGFLDHVNGNKSDNRLINLRLASNAENLQNQTRAPTSNQSTGLLGVGRAWRSRTYTARITVNKKTIHLGCFSTPHEAHQAYIEAKRQLHPFSTL